MAPDHTARGIGRQLFSRALGDARGTGHRGVLLWVLRSARGFSEVYGLRPDGCRLEEPGRLGDGVFEVRYRLSHEPTD